MRELWQFFENTHRDVNINECGIQQFEPGLNYHYKTYQSFVLHYIDSGKGTYEVNSKKYHLKAGDGFILREGSVVSYTGDKFNPWKYYWVALSGNHLSNFLKKTKLNSEDVIKFSEESESKKIIKYICEDTKSNLPELKSASWYLSQVYRLLYNLEIEFEADKFTQHNRPSIPDYAKIAYNYITTNYMRDITIQKVADFIGISRSYLYRKFKDQYNISPQDFLQFCRMMAARKLLVEQNDQIYIVSEKVGYNDQFQFSKAFKKYFNLSPANYRKKYRVTE